MDYLLLVQEGKCVDYLAHDALDEREVFAYEDALLFEQSLQTLAGHVLNQNVELVVFVACFLPVGSNAHKVKVLHDTRMLQLASNFKFVEAA